MWRSISSVNRKSQKATIKLLNYTEIRDKQVTLSQSPSSCLKPCAARGNPVCLVENSCGNHIPGAQSTHTVAPGLYLELMQRAFQRLSPQRRSQAILFPLTPDFNAETHTLQSDLSWPTHTSCDIKTQVGWSPDDSLFSTSQTHSQSRNSQPSRNQTLLF